MGSCGRLTVCVVAELPLIQMFNRFKAIYNSVVHGYGAVGAGCKVAEVVVTGRQP